MSTDIVVFSNPHSRRNRHDPGLVDRLRRLVGDDGAVVSCSDLDSLTDAARTWRGATTVAVNGGDGTTRRVFTALLQADADRPLPAVLPLCGGTMNTIARSVGVVGAPERLLAAWRRAPGPATERSTLHVHLEGADGPVEAWGSLFGLGVTVGYLEAYYAAARGPVERRVPGLAVPGPPRAAWVLGALIASTLVNGPMARRATAPWHGQVTLDGVARPDHPRLALLAGTVADLGIGFRPFAGVSDQPGAVGVIDIGSSAVGLLPDLARIYLGGPLRHPLNHRQGVVDADLQADTPFTTMIDGDILEPTRRVRLRLGPTVRWVRPA